MAAVLNEDDGVATELTSLGDTAVLGTGGASGFVTRRCEDFGEPFLFFGE